MSKAPLLFIRFLCLHSAEPAACRWNPKRDASDVQGILSEGSFDAPQIRSEDFPMQAQAEIFEEYSQHVQAM